MSELMSIFMMFVLLTWMMSVRTVENGCAADLGEVIVDRCHRRHRRSVGHLLEANEAVQPRLGQAPEIGLDHGADLGIAAGGIGVAELDDRVSRGWHLY